MLVGASTHLKWILENGIFSQQMNIPFFSTIFWDSLAFWDIIAAFLIINKPKEGILLTLTIITIDVIHNSLIILLNNQHINYIGVKMWATKNWMLIGQLLFMIFVFATIKSNLTEINCKSTFKNETNENKASH
jgi:hypothetical protein